MRQFVIGILAATILGAAAPALAQPTLVELRFASEDVPPGGVLQAKVEVTEPRPISTGSGGFDLSQFEEFLGLAANSPAGDAAAAAVIRGSSVRVAMVSPTAGLGMDPDYPILTMTVRVPPTALPGLRVPLTLASGAVFLDPTGAPYPYSFRAGEVTIAAGPSIANVIPGSGLVPAGGVITVEGAGFEPDAELRIGEVTVAATHFVSSTRLEAALGQAATMHGRRVEVRNRGSNTRTVYFAYQRTTSLGASAHPLFRVVEPAFAQRFYSDAVVSFATSGRVAGLALQNISPTPVSVTLDLLSGSVRLAQAGVMLPPNSQIVRGLSEVFGSICATTCQVRMRASAPLQVMGLSGDAAQDLAAPILPFAVVAAQFTTAVDAPSVAAGETLALTASFTPGVLPVLADAYIVLRTPDGAMLSLTPPGFVPGLVPFARNAPLSTALSLVVLRTVVPAGTPPGTYAWLSALTEPGTLNPLTAVTTTPFAVNP